ncbi:MAG TPA: hypothetical protein VGE21_00850 [Flavobacteriales bacterium]
MRIPRLLPLIALSALLMLGCRKDELFTDDPGARLTLSVDTVMFDTIFTSPPTFPVPSVTKRFTVHNRNSNAVRVDVTLQGGSPSPFRINVDGASGLSFSDVEILGGDSMYVFVEATLDQNNASNPLVIEDHIVFNTNGNEQKVLLVAWGQDAHFFRPDRTFSNIAYSIIAGLDETGNSICETVEWVNDKPYVLYGYGVVDSCSTLIIQPGVRVYLHGGSGLWVYRYGRILAQGTVEEPITFQSDRLEPYYADLPGQWDRIWVMEGDQENRFENCTIKNALVGLQCETAPWLPQQPTSENRVLLSNVSIHNSSAAGLLTRNYRVTSSNLLVTNAGQYCVALTGGGEYHFNHTTVANYWSYDIRQEPAFYLSNLVGTIAGTQIREIANSEFRNGIIYGNNGNEFRMELDGSATTDFIFTNHLFRTDQATNDPVHFPDQGSIWRNQNPGFVDPGSGNYHLLENAFARNKGAFSDDIFDLDGILRSDGQPDLGCYEWYPQ